MLQPVFYLCVFNVNFVFKAFAVLFRSAPPCAPPSGQFGQWSISYFSFQILWRHIRTKPMHGQLRSELEIHKQLYSIAFLSSSLSMVYPLLMGCLRLPFLVLLLEGGFIYPALPHTSFSDTLCPEPSSGYLYFPLGTTALPLERKVPFPHF